LATGRNIILLAGNLATTSAVVLDCKVAIPLLALAGSNAAGGRPWWTFPLPDILVFYDGVEFAVDDLLKFDFRRSRWLGSYLALMGMIGYTLCSGKNLRFYHPATYFNLAPTTWTYAHDKHG
jgi:hypothetical protein